MLNIDERQLSSILSKPGYKVSSSLSLAKNVCANKTKSVSHRENTTKKQPISKKKSASLSIVDQNRHALALSYLKLNPELETGVNLAGVKVCRANFEHWMQVRVFDYIYRFFNEEYLDFAAVPNGGLRTNNGAKDLLDEGVRNGFPDIIGDIPRGVYFGLRIELKYGSNKPSESQIIQLNRKRKNGYFCALCWSLEEACLVVDEYLSLKSGTKMNWNKYEDIWVTH
tara:strand:- start:106361 stop:107038 length:678 start_codon:yes stop_codon:yes gene_type:complete